MENINLTPIIQAIMALLASLIAYKLIPWIKARTTQAQQDNLRAVIKTAVFAAEQIYGAGKGVNKYTYVETWLNEHGYQVDRAMIEAEVKRLTDSVTSIELAEAVTVE